MRQTFSAVCPFCKETFTKPRRGNQPYRYCSRGCAMRYRNTQRGRMSEGEHRQRRRDSTRRWKQKNQERVREYKRVYHARHADPLKCRPHLNEAEKTTIMSLYTQGMNFKQIANEVGRQNGTVARYLRTQMEIRPRPVKKGPGATSWKGGRVISHGYAYIWVEPDDPMASMRDKAGRVAEHRLALARKIGRPLRATETVHHIDGDPSNNEPENLQLRQGRHGKHIVTACLDCGSHNIGPMPIAET